MQEEKKQERQYALFGELLVPVGTTVPRLTAGFYELGALGFTHGVKPTKPVSDDLIDIPGTPADDVMDDITKFLATKERYMRVGLTHKRGYLLYGPPGTGKTSLGLMVARRFIGDADGVVFHVPNSGCLAALVNIIRDVEPGRPCMFLMEEADSFVNDTTALSILDGEQSLAGAVFVAMTNYKEKMPPRIANRPGRFDRVVYVGAPPYRVQVEYLSRLVLRLDEAEHRDAATRIADALQGVTLSMGHLREAFVAHVLMGVPTEKIRERFEAMAAEPDAERTKCEECGGQRQDGKCVNGCGACYDCGGPLDADGECARACYANDEEAA